MALSYSSLAGSGGGAGGGGASNDFTINVGASGNTLVPLTTSFPVGSYICTSALSDTALDIYLINEDGTSAGYANATTATTTITASKSFNKLVIYGAANNDTLTFQFKYVFAPTGASSADFAAVPPRISSVSDSDLQNIDDTTTITGFNFAEDVEVAFTGTGYSSTAAKNIVRASATSLVVTRPDNFPTTGAPYTITVTNPGIPSPTSTSSHVLASSVTAGNAPVWVTSATLPNFVKTVAYSQAIQATDSDGGSSVTYSIISGSLPTGISFDTSTATFSGTPTENTGTPYTYVIRATDSGGNFVNRTFSLSQVVADAPTSAAGTDVGTSRAFNNGAVSVAFTAPTYTGTSSITSYTVTASTGQTASGSSSPIIVTGIATGATPTFTVTATNTGGTSLSSSASSSVTVTTVPAAPTIGTASITNSTTVSVPFTAGANGGKAISSYSTVTSPSISVSTSGTTSPLSVTGSYAAGQSYTFSIAAVNANGTSASSSASNGLTPLVLPTVSGGSLGSDATYFYRTFTANGTLAITNGSLNLDILTVGGGGGGGGGNGYFMNSSQTGTGYSFQERGAGGGGGGGGVDYRNTTLSAANHAVVVGAGGGSATSGGSSSISSITATGGSGGGNGGGGAGGAQGSPSSRPGGGGAEGGTTTPEGDYYTGKFNGGGGGGGAGSNGSNGTAALFSTNGVGGAGGSAVSYFGGNYGGGGGGSGNAAGASGGSGAGSGGSNGAGSAAGNNTGGGGGGSATSTSINGANGGSGIVVVRYLRSAVM
jgi:hypothetical protein